MLLFLVVIFYITCGEAMDLAGVATIIYGVLALVGGAIGYLKAKSKPSLISGIISGILLLIASLMQLQGNAAGVILALVVTAALVIVFTVRLIKTRKFMPAGLMTIAGVAVLVIVVSSL